MATRLPKAPLTEVVFEMHWRTIEQTIPMPYDPGYGKVFDALCEHASSLGFGRHVDFAPAYTGIGRGISRRFYRGNDDFPLLQIGQGVFAANESSNYTWEPFKKMSLDGAAVVARSYPEFKHFNFAVTRLELRYLDAFEESLTGSTDLIDFLREGANARVELPKFWSSKLFNKTKSGRLLVETELRHLPGAKFSIDLASAKKEDIPILRMESKVYSAGDNLLPRREAKFSAALDNWLTKAHEVTSPSFKAFINDELLKKFQTP